MCNWKKRKDKMGLAYNYYFGGWAVSQSKSVASSTEYEIGKQRQPEITLHSRNLKDLVPIVCSTT